MQHWEYMTLAFESKNNQWMAEFRDGELPLDEILAEMGSNGWELVSTTPIDHGRFNISSGTSYLQLIFKRPKE